MKTKIAGAARIAIILLFFAIAALAPLATSYAYTHTVLGENASTTW
jgi:hypothetical protein